MISDEIQSFRRCIRDLVALSTLPAIWTGREPLTIAEGLAEMLLSITVRPALIYVCLKGLADGAVIEVARADGEPRVAQQAAEIGRALAPYLQFGRSDLIPSIPNPIGSGLVRIVALPIGYSGENGIVVVGSQQENFPTEMDHLLLRVGANQAAIWFQQIGLLLERQETEKALAEELARRTAIALDNARLYEAERTARTEAERAGERLSLLAAVSEILIASSDYEITLPRLAHLIVSTLADWCVVDVIGEDGLIHRLAVVHRDPAKAELAAQLQHGYPALDPHGEHTIAKTLRRGQPWFDPAMSETRLVAEARDAEHLRLLRGLGFASEIVVPLIARGRNLGTLTLVRAAVEQRFEQADVTLAELLARRAALAVDNAQLYREAQQLNAELEQRVAHRTAELQTAKTRLEVEMAERQRAQAELTELQRRLMENEEVNRLYLAQELHDGPVQELYSVSYNLTELKGVLPDEASSTRLAATQATVQRAIQALRATFTELRPPALAPFGLEKAIRSHAEQFQAAHPELEMGLNLMADGQRLPERVRLALFRIYQEALNNIVRHAQARYILIRFAIDPEQTILEVQDDGRGFEGHDRLIDLARQGHLGLVGISERAEAIGGQVRIISAPGEGTIVRVVVPRGHE